MEARQLMEAAGQQAKGTLLDESYNASLVRKWSALPLKGKVVNLLEGLAPAKAKVAAMCLENQARFMTNLSEDTLSTNTGSFQKYIFPVVRRLFPNLILNDIATVQPQTGPSGAMFTLEYKYDDRKGSKYPWTGVAGQPYQMAGTYTGALAASDDAIKNFAKYYSSEYIDYDAICTDTGVGNNSFTNAGVNCRLPGWKPMRAPGTSGQRTFSVIVYCRTVEGGGSNRVLTLDATGLTTNLVDQNSNICGTLDVTTGAWTVNAILAGGGASTFASNTVIYAKYYVNSELTYTVSANRLQRMSLSLTRHDIVAEPWRLTTAWSLDAMQDLRAQHGMDLEQELVQATANEIGVEIDRTGIDMMIAGAAHTNTYAYSATFPGDIEKMHQLVTQIDALSAAIMRTGGRGPGNFVVCGPEVASLLGQMAAHDDWKGNVDLTTAASHGATNTQYPIYRAGALNAKYSVYVNAFQDPTKVLVGYKGQTWLDAGFGYAPYVPLFATETFTNPDTMMSSKGLASRGALKMLRQEYYGVCTVSGIPTAVTSL
jgi:hypothetical protein